jgi:hypothetical protein
MIDLLSYKTENGKEKEKNLFWKLYNENKAIKYSLFIE